MICSGCKNTIDDNAHFCNYCGSDLKTEMDVRTWTVGRYPENDIVVDYQNVSGQHCRFSFDGKNFSITDLDSTNGTFINNQRIAPFQESLLKPHDEVSLGSYKLPQSIFSSLIKPIVSEHNKRESPGLRHSSHMLSIGRTPDNDIVLNFPQISSQHAWLIREGDNWTIKDRNSTNHTYVNDRLSEVFQKRITPEDTLYFGSYKISAQRLLQMKKETALGQSSPRPITIKDRETIFGRDPQASIHLDYPQVSWHHAKMTRKGNDLILEDLGSTNGTYVNGQKIRSLKVTTKDTIEFGSFSFQLNENQQIIKRDYRGDIRLDAENISFEVLDRKTGVKKRLVDSVSLTIYPSEFVGLMGPAGAGKTTLMLALNGYLKPSSGTSCFNGESLHRSYDKFRGSIGYVPQDDIMHRELTVYEALYYTARLRLPSDMSNKEISDRINKVLTQVGLYNAAKNLDVRNVIIGSPEKKGISGGQRKRVNLAMELLSDPGLLFLDEPTSGLSSEDALVVMALLRNLADEGKTIILTIHQPSLEAYKKMDNVIIITAGKLAYYGPTYPDSLTFFNPHKKADDILSNSDNALKGLKEGEDKNIDWQREYKNSQYFKSYVEERKDSSTRAHRGSSTRGQSTPGSSLRQWWTLTQRYFTIKRKDIVNTAILLLQAPIIAVLIAIVYGTSKIPPLTPLFLLIVSALWFGTSNAAREIVSEKAIYLRERMVNLKILPYIFSKYTVLSFLCLIQCIIMVAILHPALELESEFISLFGITFLAAIAGLSIGLFVSSVTTTQQQAVAIIPLILIPMVILGGGIQKVKNMNKTTYTLSTTVPSRWAYELILHAEEPEKTEDTVENGLSADANPQLEQTLKVEELYGDRMQDEYVLVIVLFIFVLAFLGLTIGVIRSRDKV